MPVNSQHEQYEQHLDIWRTVRDCVAGSKQVKAKGATYLPKFSPGADDQEETRYKAYKDRAVFYNFTKRTLASLVGAAFRKEPTIGEAPEELEKVMEDSDNLGNNIGQLARSCIYNVMSVGRHGLLVDYPKVEPGLSVAEIQARGIRPFVKEYRAEDIINWRVEDEKLVLVVLAEIEKVRVDDYSFTNEKRFRVLRLEDGVYTQTLRKEDDTVVENGQFIPTKADGSNWDTIPFVFPGAMNNTPDVDQAVLYDLAVVNIGHYRNSADYEEGVFIHGQPMLHIDIGEMNTETWEKLNPNGVQVGARRGITTSGGGSTNLMQAEANGAAYEAMTHKEQQAIQIGARLVQKGGANETAEAVRANVAAEHSVLDNVVSNVQEALLTCLGWVRDFLDLRMELPEDLLKLNDDFFDTVPDAQVIAQMMGLESIGIIPRQVIISYLRRAGVITDDLSDEAIEEMIANSGIE